VALAVGSVAAVLLLTQDHSRGTSAPSPTEVTPKPSKFPTLAERRLLSHIPRRVKPCERWGGDTGDLANLACYSPRVKGVGVVSYSLFSTRAKLAESFGGGLSVGGGVSYCTAIKDLQRPTTYTADGREAGRVACFRTKTNQGVTTDISWSNTRLKILADATVYASYLQGALYHAWVCCLGPGA